MYWVCRAMFIDGEVRRKVCKLSNVSRTSESGQKRGPGDFTSPVRLRCDEQAGGFVGAGLFWRRISYINSCTNWVFVVVGLCRFKSCKITCLDGSDGFFFGLTVAVYWLFGLYCDI